MSPTDTLQVFLVLVAPMKGSKFIEDPIAERLPNTPPPVARQRFCPPVSRA